MKVVLAYSGGLDTSVAVKWLQEQYNAQVIAVIVDIGQPENLMLAQRKALSVGAAESLIINAKEEFVHDFIAPAVQSNLVYQKQYPLATALARPLIAKQLVEIAKQKQADAIAHGCTAKGNDQVRFELAIKALSPDLQVLAPARDWDMTREQEIEYAKQHNIEVPATKSSPYSIDENLYGRSIEAGDLEDPWVEPPPDVFKWTAEPSDAPDNPEYVELVFVNGLPVVFNEEELALEEIIKALNRSGGQHGIGRLDLIEERVVGIKSREVYECPAAVILLTAHQELENLTLPYELLAVKYQLEQQLSELVYAGKWYNPLREAISSFMSKTQKRVEGTVRLRLYKGACTVVGRKSPWSLYDASLATYDEGDTFPHQAAEGFLKLFSLPIQVWSAYKQEGKK